MAPRTENAPSTSRFLPSEAPASVGCALLLYAARDEDARALECAAHDQLSFRESLECLTGTNVNARPRAQSVHATAALP